MKIFRSVALSLALLSTPAVAQWQTPNHSTPIGRGAGVTGFGNAAPGAAGIPLTSNGPTVDPSYGPVSNAGMANMPGTTVKCNPTGVSGAVQDCTSAQFMLLYPPRSVTGNDTASLTDCGKELLATGGFNTLTLPAASSVPAGCEIGYRNNEVYSGIGSGRGKHMVNFPVEWFQTLYPGQAGKVLSDGTNWSTTVAPGLWNLPTSAELCVRQDGVNTSDGLGDGTSAAGCLASVQTALVHIGSHWNGLGYNSCAIGIYAGGTSIINETASQTGQSIGCYITVNVRGIITWTSTAQCWTAGDGSITVFNFNLGATPTFKCNTNNVALIGAFYGHQDVIYDINGTYTWVPGGANDDFLVLDAQGRATINATTMTIGDGAVRSANSIFNCNFGCRGAQISGSVVFAANVTLAQSYRLKSTSVMNIAAAYSGAPTVTNPSVPTGGSILNTNGTAIPGGTTSGTQNGLVCAGAPC